MNKNRRVEDSTASPSGHVRLQMFSLRRCEKLTSTPDSPSTRTTVVVAVVFRAVCPLYYTYHCGRRLARRVLFVSTGSRRTGAAEARFASLAAKCVYYSHSRI